MGDKIHRNSLQPGHKLHWYRIEKILGQGGFGITYLAHDFNLDRPVAIKEYLPIELAVRERDFSVHPVTEEQGEKFRWGLDRFITEARTLAKFKHPNIVHVLNVFEENNTAYMVMEYEHGESLQDILNRRKTLEEAELINILIPILGGLQKVHEAGFIHRDIKPANIFIHEDGSPVLLDFGSARQALSMATQTLTSLVSPGYAPYEQYYSKSDQQGPWTDIYGLGATLYRAISGVAPMDAVDRSRGILKGEKDVFVSAQELGRGRYSERFLQAVDHALQFKEEDRPQTISAWKSEFDLPEDPIRQAIVAERTPTQPGTKVLERQQQNKWLYGKVAMLFVLIGIGALYLYHGEIQDYLFGPTKTQLEAERQRDEQEKRLAALKQKEEEDRRRKEEEKHVEEERQAEVERLRQEEARKLEAERLALEEEREILQEEERKRAEAEAQRQAEINRQREEEEQNRLAEEKAKRDVEEEAKKAEIDNQNAMAGEQRFLNGEGKYNEEVDKQGKLEKEDDGLFKDAINLYNAKKYLEAFELFEALAKKGHPASQYYLALMYGDGDQNIPDDHNSYKSWMGKAANNGHIIAQFIYAITFTKDGEQAELFHKAAKQGYAPAQLQLGLMYRKGEGVIQDNNEALKWIKIAAEQGDPFAQQMLGVEYKLILNDRIKSLAWLILAGKYGDSKLAKAAANNLTIDERRKAIILARELWNSNNKKWKEYYETNKNDGYIIFEVDPWTESEWKEIMEN